LEVALRLSLGDDNLQRHLTNANLLTIEMTLMESIQQQRNSKTLVSTLPLNPLFS